jgi:hypothetical protein
MPHGAMDAVKRDWRLVVDDLKVRRAPGDSA